jgi:hypothetical protein
MKTSKLFSLILVATLFLSGETVFSAQADGHRQTRQISGFHGVSVSSGIDLFLTQKNIEEVSVEAVAEDQDKIITKVEDGILKIYIRDKSWFGFGWTRQPRKVYVSFTTLDNLQASAGSDVTASSVLKLDKLHCQASSGSDIKLELVASELVVETSSGSDITLKGKASIIRADASSGGDIIADELETKKCKASVSSGSDIKINVLEELDAQASSGGDIVYSGNPGTKQIHKSSGGDVHGR